jgi:hypothetical protein
MPFGFNMEIIKGLRKAAKVLGVSRQYVHELVREDTPTGRTFCRYTQVWREYEPLLGKEVFVFELKGLLEFKRIFISKKDK